MVLHNLIMRGVKQKEKCKSRLFNSVLVNFLGKFIGKYLLESLNH